MYKFKSKRYDLILGFKEDQWWIYDKIDKVFIDPPAEILEQFKWLWYENKENYERRKKIMKEEKKWNINV